MLSSSSSLRLPFSDLIPGVNAPGFVKDIEHEKNHFGYGDGFRFERLRTA